MAAADSIRGLVDQVDSLEKSVMTVIFDATRNLALLTNCQPFLMFESKGRRFYCGSEDLCHLYASGELRPRASDTKMAEGVVAEAAWKRAEGCPDEVDQGADEEEAEVGDDVFVNGHDDTESAMDMKFQEPDVGEEEVKGEDRGAAAASPEKFKCHVCGQAGFSDADELRLHIHKYHQRSPLRCPQCYLVLNSRAAVKRHLACIHDIGRRKFLCRVCGFCSPRKDGVMVHMKRKHADRPHAFVEVSFNDVDRTYRKPGDFMFSV